MEGGEGQRGEGVSRRVGRLNANKNVGVWCVCVVRGTICGGVWWRGGDVCEPTGKAHEVLKHEAL